VVIAKSEIKYATGFTDKKSVLNSESVATKKVNNP
jgi:hypothetical protein